MSFHDLILQNCFIDHFNLFLIMDITLFESILFKSQSARLGCVTPQRFVSRVLGLVSALSHSGYLLESETQRILTSVERYMSVERCQSDFNREFDLLNGFIEAVVTRSLPGAEIPKLRMVNLGNCHTRDFDLLRDFILQNPVRLLNAPML